MPFIVQENRRKLFYVNFTFYAVKTTRAQPQHVRKLYILHKLSTE